ncbi:MAG TPA: hypothetical protein VFJ47_12435 [Terriglobales bacterium]|nr:hypothetical protein [Terriglobales bacterium]
MRSLLTLAVLSAVLSFSASGQTQYRVLGRAGAAIPLMPVIAPTGTAHHGVNITIGAPQRPSHHRPFAPGFFLGAPWGYFDSGSEQAPQVIVLQQPAVSAPQIVEQAPPSIMPLLIELQDGRYVRYRSDPQGADTDANTRSVRGAQIKPETSTKPALDASTAELLPVVLLFRDGHREQVDSYAIFSGAIQINATYSTAASSAYWANGSWARSIPLAALDLPATLQLNRERGVKFVLPAGPNEVVTRP